MKNPGVERIPKYNYENYIRWIIRSDRSFLLNFSLHNILNNSKTKIYYRNNVFKTYMDYIKYLINYYNSGKCKTILSHPNAFFKLGIYPSASDMISLAEHKYQKLFVYLN